MPTLPTAEETGTTRLWTPTGFREDDWTHTDDPGAPSGNGRSIMPLEAFLALDPERRGAARERLGVLLQPGDRLDAIVGLLDDLALVALAFPAFSDGRSFSKAELLRSRHGFKGAVRATGQVLVDQLPHMLRLGINEFEIINPVLIGRLERGQSGGIGFHYQPAARASATTGSYSWRRVRAG